MTLFFQWYFRFLELYLIPFSFPSCGNIFHRQQNTFRKVLSKCVAVRLQDRAMNTICLGNNITIIIAEALKLFALCNRLLDGETAIKTWFCLIKLKLMGTMVRMCVVHTQYRWTAHLPTICVQTTRNPCTHTHRTYTEMYYRYQIPKTINSWLFFKDNWKFVKWTKENTTKKQREWVRENYDFKHMNMLILSFY